jgi:hypothetical protein
MTVGRKIHIAATIPVVGAALFPASLVVLILPAFLVALVVLARPAFELPRRNPSTPSLGYVSRVDAYMGTCTPSVKLVDSVQCGDHRP